ncbi:DUF1654 domain-containing protein [Halomonas sp. McH1-25]|uniref:DUF1654 domain-containing protein n=1 Tax=unclassified Halomonas TaxID=2609666 RepID=UPI001EF5FBFF|nr:MULTISPECIES: DUF1654 domain-containing protein [unclassified Halomonas]MCG7598425.1 DUF1654 domain-containing protein [Halomonas sp. McH1-25]MCP1343761.1 DUF1654 domain-containing protein [Halomonas sp. FL8]MCP1361740.1 DUF1654 domain-containing protein [Halomonas sp. BBD45]MCP1363992.1 DUF1654 domain-containing protein [Halomonas sp. BBD48]
MAVQAQAAETPPSYLKLGQRVQRAVNTPRARMAHSVILERQPDESVEDWEAMLEELGTHGNVTITRFDDDSVGLRWNVAERAV